MSHPVRAAFGALALLAAAAHAPAEAAEDNVYTTREPGLIRPLLDAYTRQTGTKVNAVFVQAGLAERDDLGPPFTAFLREFVSELPGEGASPS